jgi:hypothetical protein
LSICNALLLCILTNPISFTDFRIHKYASCSNECFILALIYIDRLIQRNNFLLTELNVHRVVITAVLLAAKFFDDAYYNNAYYAKVGGVLVSEMNGLEVDFLFRINFSLHVTPDLFQKYREELLSHSAGNDSSPAAPQLTTAPAQIGTTATPLHMNGTVYVGMDVEPRLSSEQQTHHYVEKRHATHITPSPPESARAMPSNDMSSDIEVLEHPHLQQPNTMPPYNPNRRCSPQPMYAHNASSDSYYMVENNVAYPIHHGVLVHHNHAKVEHGFHNTQSHPDPVYTDTNPHQYFMGGANMLTGCPGGS